MNESSEIIKQFGNKLRVRACGICIHEGRLLMVKHLNIGKQGYLWMPPGGGVNYGESVEECLIREFKEEVGLTVSINEFLFVYEYLSSPLHAIELFFKVEATGGELIKGMDPELPLDQQMIDEVKFCDQKFINDQSPTTLHGILHVAGSIHNLEKLKGYYFNK